MAHNRGDRSPKPTTAYVGSLPLFADSHDGETRIVGSRLATQDHLGYASIPEDILEEPHFASHPGSTGLAVFQTPRVFELLEAYHKEPQPQQASPVPSIRTHESLESASSRPVLQGSNLGRDQPLSCKTRDRSRLDQKYLEHQMATVWSFDPPQRRQWPALGHQAASSEAFPSSVQCHRPKLPNQYSRRSNYRPSGHISSTSSGDSETSTSSSQSAGMVSPLITTRVSPRRGRPLRTPNGCSKDLLIFKCTFCSDAF